MNTILSKFKKIKDGSDFKELIVQLMLFKTCNNACSFCFQQNCRSEMPTIDFFKSNVDKYCETIDKCFSDWKNYHKIKIGIAGGEPLYDETALNPFLKILETVAKYPIEIGVVTNLLYDNLYPVKTVIDYMLQTGRKFKLYTSYDFGPLRFDTSYKLNTYIKNIFELKDEYSDRLGEYFDIRVDTIRTKYMISSLESEDEYAKYFDTLMRSFNVTVNELTGSFDYALTFDESVLLWKMLFDRYPDLVKKQFSSIHSHRNCFNTTCRTVIFDKIHTGCLTTHGKLDCGNDKDVKNKVLCESISKFNCITCRYFSNCPMACLVERRFDKCDMFEVYDYINKSK